MKKVISIFLVVFILFTITLFGCNNKSSLYSEYYNKNGLYYHCGPYYSTKYTKEEHLQRLEDKTIERFRYEIKNGYLEYWIYNLYTFPVNEYFVLKEPNYFLIVFKWKNKNVYHHGDCEGGFPDTPVYSYIVGYIDSDKYHVPNIDVSHSIEGLFPEGNDSFKGNTDGPSYYFSKGVAQAGKKLYFGEYDNDKVYIYVDDGVYYGGILRGLEVNGLESREIIEEKIFSEEEIKQVEDFRVGRTREY